MKRTLIALACLVPFAAAADEYAVEREAEASGLTKRELRMIAGAPSSYAEYRTSYRMARDRLRREAYADTGPLRAVEDEAVEDEWIESEAPPREDAETYALPPD